MKSKEEIEETTNAMEKFRESCEGVSKACIELRRALDKLKVKHPEAYKSKYHN